MRPLLGAQSQVGDKEACQALTACLITFLTVLPGGGVDIMYFSPLSFYQNIDAGDYCSSYAFGTSSWVKGQHHLK